MRLRVSYKVSFRCFPYVLDLSWWHYEDWVEGKNVWDVTCEMGGDRWLFWPYSGLVTFSRVVMYERMERYIGRNLKELLLRLSKFLTTLIIWREVRRFERVKVSSLIKGDVVVIWWDPWEYLLSMSLTLVRKYLEGLRCLEWVPHSICYVNLRMGSF